MRRILILTSVVAFLAFSLLALAQEAKNDRAWTLEECIQAALRNRPELEIANLDVALAQQQLKEAQAYYYPRFNVTGGYTHFNKPVTFDVDVDVRPITDPANQFLQTVGITLPSVLSQQVEVGLTNWYAVSLDLSQPLYSFGRIEEGIRQAELGQAISRNQKEKRRREVILEVKKGFYQFLLAREVGKLVNEAEARAGVVVRMVKIDYETSIPEKEQKGTTRLDYLKAKNFHSELRARLSETGKNVKLAALALKMAVGLKMDESLGIVGTPLELMPMPSPDAAAAKETTRDKNLDLKTTELGVQFLDSRRKAARAEYFPKVGLQGQFMYPEDRFGTKNAWYLGVGLTMPIFDGFLNKAKVGQAEAQFQKARGQRHLLESALSAQVDHLHSTLVELGERIGILRAAIQEAQERVQLASDGYAAGMTEYDELLFAQRTELEMKTAYLQSLFLYQLALSELEFVSGEG
jgi:outer membrane protein TolC